MRARAGKPLQHGLAIVDEHLTRWGQEVGSDADAYRRIGWGRESILSRVQREGPVPSQKAHFEISRLSIFMDETVGLIPPRTREALRLWYCEGRGMNQAMCAQRMGMSVRTFERHLANGRQALAEWFGLLN
jgi:predicted DNA-binding protein (UPF0251 family)